jgi:hypothetical protein
MKNPGRRRAIYQTSFPTLDHQDQVVALSVYPYSASVNSREKKKEKKRKKNHHVPLAVLSPVRFIAPTSSLPKNMKLSSVLLATPAAAMPGMVLPDGHPSVHFQTWAPPGPNDGN